MKVWLLRPVGHPSAYFGPWVPWYDKCFGMVVRAADEDFARTLAHEEAHEEGHEEGHDENIGGRRPWLDPALSTCVELTGEGDACVVIRDIHHA